MSMRILCKEVEFFITANGQVYVIWQAVERRKRKYGGCMQSFEYKKDRHDLRPLHC